MPTHESRQTAKSGENSSRGWSLSLATLGITCFVPTICKAAVITMSRQYPLWVSLPAMRRRTTSPGIRDLSARPTCSQNSTSLYINLILLGITNFYNILAECQIILKNIPPLGEILWSLYGWFTLFIISFMVYLYYYYHYITYYFKHF